MRMWVSLRNANHPEYGVANFPLPIYKEEYDEVLAMLEGWTWGPFCIGILMINRSLPLVASTPGAWHLKDYGPAHGCRPKG